MKTLYTFVQAVSRCSLISRSARLVKSVGVLDQSTLNIAQMVDTIAVCLRAVD
jgi:hypothetical protein